jgi:hypothetical protein
MPRSGDLRAGTPPLICSTGISWQSCQARATSCSPVRNYLAPATQAQTLPIPSTWLQTLKGVGPLRPGPARISAAALSMITKEKSPMRAFFFRDHEISRLGPAGADPLTVGVRGAGS